MNEHSSLLGTASAATQVAVLRRVDAGLRATLLSRNVPSAALTAFVLEHGTLDERVALAHNWFVAPEVLVALAADRHPAVAAALHENWAAPREALLPGLRLVPPRELVNPGWMDRELGARYRSARLGLAVELDDPDVTVEALTVFQPEYNRSGAAAIVVRGLSGLLRAAGADAVRAVSAKVHPVPAPQPTVVSDALDHPTDTARLAAALDHLCGPAGLLDRVRAGTSSWGAAFLAPRGPFDWPAVEAAHRADPLPNRTLAGLTLQVGCPPTLRPARDRRPGAPAPSPEVAALTASALGTDPERWLVALRLLADFPGTVPELLDTAAKAST
ncbi:hypothetical protein [Yinghuangia seranimata]|uniref:hypothetical protein n=1 Tax=Yinghuangia seranimata TaxID=408067 RepID=UPI00248B6B01|nr:hypothetical protein [Yinghuangia seranimata]MDI2125512.1 hypothetical protein [Yinghuangia seranimata]